MFVVCFYLIFVPLCEFSTLVCCVFVFFPHTLSCTSLWYLVVLFDHDIHNTHMRTLTFETRTWITPFAWPLLVCVSLSLFLSLSFPLTHTCIHIRTRARAHTHTQPTTKGLPYSRGIILFCGFTGKGGREGRWTEIYGGGGIAGGPWATVCVGDQKWWTRKNNLWLQVGTEEIEY